MNLLNRRKHATDALKKRILTGLLPYRDPASNKGTYGKILIIAGNDDIYGAAYLSAAAAYGTGAGLVKVFTSEKNRDNLMRMLPEAMVSTFTKDDFGDAGIAKASRRYCMGRCYSMRSGTRNR